LALQLIENNFSVLVIDKPELSNCSKIAAGIYNPVVFKRLTKSWMLDELFPVMLDFYKNLEKKWNCKLITERHIIKLFSEQQEIDLWKKKANGELNSYLDESIYNSTSYESINTNELGYSKVIRSGNLDVSGFLEHTRTFLKESESFLEEQFDFRSLTVSETIAYKKISTKRIIFCEGHLIKKNPYFNYIPFKPAKGEVLEIGSKELKIGEDIINKNAFVMNVTGHKFKAGATYNWEDLTDIPTEEGKREIETKLKKITTASYDIISHKAGVRPSVIDRRPVMGSHPKHENILLFNGLGTKGVMLAPYFASHFISYLKGKSALNKEVDLIRFKPLE
jgi:glycine oxidase